MSYTTNATICILSHYHNLRHNYSTNHINHHSEWVDNATRKNAERKADAITDMIGYPTYIMQEDSADLNNKYGDLNVKDDEYYQNTIQRNEFALKVCEGDIIFVIKLHNINSQHLFYNCFLFLFIGRHEEIIQTCE